MDNHNNTLFQGREWKAYMTLEASWIIGWIVFLMVALIYLAFYSYDRCVLFQDAYAFAFRVSAKPLDADGKNQYGNQKIKEQFGKKYFGVGNLQTSVEATGKTVTVQADWKIMLPFLAKIPTLPETKWTKSCRVQAEVINPTETIRKLNRLQRITGE